MNSYTQLDEIMHEHACVLARTLLHFKVIGQGHRTGLSDFPPLRGNL